MSVAIVQGASGGQGLALTAHLLKHTSLKVYALTHGKGERLQDLGKSDRLTVLPGVDIKEERDMEDAAKTVKEREGKAAVRLIACMAGIVCACCTSADQQLTPEKSLGGIDYARALDQFQVNTLGHLLTYKHFVPLLPNKKEWRDVTSRWSEDPAKGLIGANNSLCWSLSARVGSISDNEKGGWYSYRASKAALNQIIRSLDHEVCHDRPRLTPARQQIILRHRSSVSPRNCPYILLETGGRPGRKARPRKRAV